MKKCTKCYIEKEYEDFHKRSKNKDGLRHWCKKCHNGYNSKWAKNNPEKVAAIDKKRFKNPSRKASKLANESNRRATKLEATPQWLSQFDKEYIKSLYIQAEELTKITGEKHEVHHSLPLQEFKDKFIGLQVPWNLEVLTKEEHLEAHRQLRKQYGR